MEFELEHKVSLNEHPKREGLYFWCLQELDSKGNALGDELIPYKGGLFFTINKISLQRTISISSSLSQNEIEQDSIFVSVSSDISFSMCGTDREIEQIRLSIYPISRAKEKKEQCCIRPICIDYLDIQLVLNSERFYRLAKSIEDKSIDVAELQLSNISGIYIGWTPTGEISEAKVLTDNIEHELLLPENCSIDAPRLGDVGEFNLITDCHINLKHDFQIKEEITSPENKADQTELLTSKIVNIQEDFTKLIKSIRIIIILLILLFITNVI